MSWIVWHLEKYVCISTVRNFIKVGFAVVGFTVLYELPDFLGLECFAYYTSWFQVNT